MNNERITIRDVAASAGVSHQTVSRVINKSERVNEETRIKVESAIEKLGYQPNAIARFMAKGRTKTLACFSPNLTDYTYASIIEGAEFEARQAGYFLMSASAPDTGTFSMLVEQLVASRRTEGLLVINPFLDNRHTQLPQFSPTVYVGARSSVNTMDSVFLDDEEAGCLAIRHLLELGHRSIAMITGPFVEDCCRDRQSGYVACLEDADINFDPKKVVEGDWTATSGYKAVQHLLANKIQFSAIFAQNDRMAVGAIRALREAGKSVPEDVSVIGFDDMPLASYYDPALTTIRQDPFSMGREAARLLIRAIENPEKQRRHAKMPVELILRKSTAVFHT
ncbi:MAG: LacI family DNA-binding transcriptional regulator [Anaerolineaceae bacterium]|nr:LacI family DNA-binding transcriptional regulator [Anaerolineaceae bacterium]